MAKNKDFVARTVVKITRTARLPASTSNLIKRVTGAAIINKNGNGRCYIWKISFGTPNNARTISSPHIIIIIIIVTVFIFFFISSSVVRTHISALHDVRYNQGYVLYAQQY